MTYIEKKEISVSHLKRTKSYHFKTLLDLLFIAAINIIK